MNYPPPHRISMRKTVQLMVILTILAWATQTLFHQWGYGATIQPKAADPPTTIEMRQEATVTTSTITLKDVARLKGDAGAQIQNIAVSDLEAPALQKEVTSTQIREALQSAGCPAASLTFTGSSRCTVTRVLPAPPETAQKQPTTKPTYTAHAGDFITVNFAKEGEPQILTVLKVIETGTDVVRAKNESTGNLYFIELTSPTEANCLPYLATTD